MDNLERVATSSILTKGDVAHLVHLKVDTVRKWSMRSSTGRPPLITQGRRGYGPNPPTIPLLGLSEASLMKHLVEDRKIGPRQLGNAVRGAKEEDPYAFAYEDFYTDGTEIFVELLGGMERLRDRQRTLREVLEPFARKINFKGGLMSSFTVAEMGSTRVIIDPRYRSGRPYLEDSGVPVFTILDELAGDTRAEQIASDFEISKEAVLDVRKHRRELAPIA